MTNKQLYNLVFENFVQAKRELIREGYRKGNLDEVDFNEVFNKTKTIMQEKKIQSLQRENKMLKSKLQKEALVGGQGGKGSSGSYRMIDTGFRKIGKFFGNPDDTLTDVAMQLNKKADDYRILLQYISDGTLNSDAKIARAISFVDALERKVGDGDEFQRALPKGIMKIGSNKDPESGIFENFKSKKRRRMY